MMQKPDRVPTPKASKISLQQLYLPLGPRKRVAPHPRGTVIRDPFAVRFHLTGTHSGQHLLTSIPFQATLRLKSLAQNCKDYQKQPCSCLSITLLVIAT